MRHVSVYNLLNYFNFSMNLDYWQLLYGPRPL